MSEEHILIVEDDETIHNMIDEYLEKDYICVDAYSGTEARLILQHTEVSLVLLDLMLPGVSGEQLLRELKQKQLPVIVLSAKDGIDDRVALLNEGADDYLCKPFDLKELKARIQVQLRKRMSKQEHALAVDGVVLLPDFCHLEIQGMKIRLTRHEYRILELLLLERFVFSFITAFIYWSVIIVMVVVENLWQQDSFASFSILQFICYSLMQMLILTVIASFLNMLIHATGSKVLAILVSVGYGSMTVFMLHAGIMSLLKVEYTDYILYAISGQLPYSWDAVFYSRAAMVAITSAILYNIGSYVLLRKKDLK